MAVRSLSNTTPRVIILAAGFGSRLGSYTEERHKCLVPVGGRPLLARTLDTLRDAGLREVCLVIGHLGAQIRSFTTAWAGSLDLAFVENPDVASTGTAYSLSLGLGAQDGARDVLIVEADVAFSPEALKSVLNDGHRSSTLVAAFEDGITGSAVECHADGHVRDWLHASHQGPDFDPARAYKTVNLTRVGAAEHGRLRSAVKSSIAERANAPLEYAMRKLVVDGEARIYAAQVGDARWFEVDTEEDLARANRIFNPEMQA